MNWLAMWPNRLAGLSCFHGSSSQPARRSPLPLPSAGPPSSLTRLPWLRLVRRSAGLLHHLVELGGPGASVEGCEHPIPALEGDFSLNAANALSADLLLRSGLRCAGLRRGCFAGVARQASCVGR